MVGLSYGGISQLFVAATRPPSLAAITPLSVIDSTATTLYPGGILNTGFALSWAKDRVRDAKPASANGGQPWALKRIREGDKTCKANQALHPEAVDLLAKTERNRFYVPEVADPLAPATFVQKIRVPTFLACQWTDEQTGGHCPTLASRFTGTDRAVVHVHERDAHRLARPRDVHPLVRLPRALRREPGAALPAGTAALAPVLYRSILGVEGVGCRPTRSRPSRRWRPRAPRSRRCRPSASCSTTAGVAAGTPVPAFERSYPRWPVPGTTASSFHLGAGGALADAEQPAGEDRFTWNPRARPATDFRGDTGAGTNGLWTATPSYDWPPEPARHRARLHDGAADRRHHGASARGALRAWFRATVPDVDLQATITEVRPDGARVVRAERLAAVERAQARRPARARCSSRFPA